MMQCVAVCCSVLQCVAVCCSVLQCVAVCCSAAHMKVNQNRTPRESAQVCVLQCALQCDAVCVAVCCSALQCVAARHT